MTRPARYMTMARCGLLFIVMVFIGILSAQPLAAMGPNFFDNTADKGGVCDVLTPTGDKYDCNNSERSVRLMAGETMPVPNQQTHVKAYFEGLTNAAGQPDQAKLDAKKPVIVIKGFWFCPGRQVGANNQDHTNNGVYETKPLPDGANITKFDIGGTYNSEQDRAIGAEPYVATYRTASSDECDPSNPYFDKVVKAYKNIDWFKTVDGIPGMLSVDILVRHVDKTGGECRGFETPNQCDGISNTFTLASDFEGAAEVSYIGAVANDRGAPLGYGVTMRNAITSTIGEPNFEETSMSYRLRFGSDCKINAGEPKWVFVALYDHDYGSGDKQKSLNVRMYNASRGKWKKQGTWREPNQNLTPAEEWSDNTPPFYSEALPRPPGAADMPPSNDNGTTKYWFQAEKDNRYFIDILYNNSGLVYQFGLPFDAIYSQRTCQRGSFKPQVDISPSPAEDEAPVTATASVTYTGSGPAQAKIKRDFWYTNSLQDTPPATYPRPPGIDQTLPVTSVTYASGTKPLPDWSTPKANSTYRYACTRLEIIPNDSTIEVDPPAKTCTFIGKYPSLEGRGGDVRSGGALREGTLGCTSDNTSANGSIIGHRYRVTGKGSRVQYAALAAGEIRDFGSSGNVPGSNAQVLYFGSKSAYSTPPLLAKDGFFYLPSSSNNLDGADTHCLPDFDNLIPPRPPSTPIPPDSLPPNNHVTLSPNAGSYDYTFKPNADGRYSVLDIPGRTVAPGSPHNIRVSAENCSTGKYIVRITGDITPAITVPTSVSAIPRFNLAIMSPCIDLVVVDGVGNIYGVYATKGNLMTCAGFLENGFGFVGNNAPFHRYFGSPAPILSSEVCKNQLTVNGLMIVAKSAYTYRTFSNGTQPAEIFNLDPRVLLSDYARASESGTLQVDDQMELPPRY